MRHQIPSKYSKADVRRHQRIFPVKARQFHSERDFEGSRRYGVADFLQMSHFLPLLETVTIGIILRRKIILKVE